MFAIVEIAGQQFKVEKDQTVYVHRLPQAEGASIELENVLLVNNNGNVQVGLPTVSGAKISATVLNHLKGDKVIVFKKKRRKGYRKLNGHRQALTKIKINSINA
jgi:large subunit ribosomal protein L21